MDRELQERQSSRELRANLTYTSSIGASLEHT
jgi:hypothetical protein